MLAPDHSTSDNKTAEPIVNPQLVDFYLISNAVSDAQLKLASRLSNKLIGLHKKVLLVTDNTNISQRLSNVMWTFSDSSFVAHDHINEINDGTSSSNLIEDTQDDTPKINNITIAELDLVSLQSLQVNYDVLINLCTSVPIIIEHFSRIIEIIEAEDDAKAAGRLRYQEYQRNKVKINTHPLEI